MPEHQPRSYRKKVLIRGSPWVGVGLLAAGGILLGWGFWPARQVEQTLTIQPEQMQLPGRKVSAISEARTLTLTTPTVIRAGDQAAARIVFAPSQAAEGQAEPGQPTDDIFVETRLELPSITIDPAGTAGQVLPRERAVSFGWTLLGDHVGEVEGTAWLSLRYGSLSDENSQTIALAAPRVRVRVTLFWIFNGPAARWSGGLAFLSGLGLVFWRWKNA
jgi:hypothetical protein